MKFRFFLLCALLCVGCTYDYDMKDDLANFKPQVVVNSIINPNMPVTVDLFWSRHYSEKGEFMKVADFHVELYEDGLLVAKCEGKYSVTFKGIIPKIGRTYRLKISVPEYGEVTAETIIPTLTEAQGVHTRTVGRGRVYQHLRVNSVKPSEKCRAVWVKCYGEYENDSLITTRELYSNTPFADQVNTVLDATDATDRGSNVGFEHFIRVPYQNIGMVTPLDFSVWLDRETSCRVDVENEADRPLDENGNPIYYKYFDMRWIRVDIITPSDDYDRYYKTLYRQQMLSFDPDMPFVGEAVPVYSNIKNGLGIFAGYSVTILKLTINE